MKIIMKTSEEKGSSNGQSSGNPKFRIAVIGQHEVGKSALTVRYLTRRYIGEYKSNTDLLYRQTLTVTHGSSLDIEIVDISTKEDHRSCSNESEFTFPSEEMQRADAFIIVYSITDRNSFTFALQILASIAAQQSSHNQGQQSQSPSQSNNGHHHNHPHHNHHHSHHNHHHNNHSNQQQQNQQPHSPPPSIKPTSIVLLANKNDLEHLRAVEKVEGLAAAMQYGCHFNEISVAENSPELYQSFHTIISNFSQQQSQVTSKRKFSVSKMLGNLRIGRTSPCQQILSQASIVDTTADSTTDNRIAGGDNSGKISCSNNSCGGKVCGHVRNNSSESSSHQSHISSSICHIKSKIVEFHSLKKRHNSPPICSL